MTKQEFLSTVKTYLTSDLSEKTKKAEISRDFSAFFAPNIFRISIDPFSIFLRAEGFELTKGLKYSQSYGIIK